MCESVGRLGTEPETDSLQTAFRYQEMAVAKNRTETSTTKCRKISLVSRRRRVNFGGGKMETHV